MHKHHTYYMRPYTNAYDVRYRGKPNTFKSKQRYNHLCSIRVTRHSCRASKWTYSVLSSCPAQRKINRQAEQQSTLHEHTQTTHGTKVEALPVSNLFLPAERECCSIVVILLFISFCLVLGFWAIEFKTRLVFMFFNGLSHLIRNLATV